MKRLAIIIGCMLAAQMPAGAQKPLNPKPQEPTWENRPIVHSVPPEYLAEHYYVVLNDETVDYRNEGGYANRYSTMHRTLKVLDEKGIESCKTFAYTLLTHGIRVPLVKARTIMPDGRVQDIAKEMIKVTKDEMGRYKIVVAPEGMAINSEVEILVTSITRGFFGSLNFQYPVPVEHAHFKLSYPKDMIFEEKGYNGFPNAQDKLAGNRRHIEVSVSDIPALRSEPYSFYNANRMRVEYRLHHYDYVNYNDRSKVDTWDDFARYLFDDYYKVTEKEKAAVNRYLTELGVHAGGNEAENIKKIENGIKKDIALYAAEDEYGDQLDSIIARKGASSTGYLRLFAACFTQAVVNHQLGKAGDRSEHRFDAKFDNWSNLDHYVFYFPEQKKYLSPLNVYLRYPIIPTGLTSNKGVFCLIPPKGTANGRLAEVRKIEPLPASASQRNIAAGISFIENMDAHVDVSYAYTGYAATDLRQALFLEKQDKEHELVEHVVTIADRPSDILNYSISNEALENANTNKPLEITATVNTAQLTEKAGNQYLLKPGAIMGSRAGLYTEKKRELPIDLDHPSSSNITITVNIPKGYKIMNPEVLNITADYVDKNLVSLMSFKSNYALVTDKKNGDKLVITVTENYPQVHFPVADFDRFREVVDAASDFNKVTLLLVKKGGDGGAKPKAVAKK